MRTKTVKVIKRITIVIAVIALLFGAAAVYKYSGVKETGVRNNELYVINNGTGSRGSNADYFLDRDDIITELEHYNEHKYRSLIPNIGGLWFPELQFGWRFGALKDGECCLLVREHDCADIAYVDLYHITVDKDLKISYETERVEVIESLERYARDLDFYELRDIELGYKGKTYSIVSGEGKKRFVDAISRTYGINSHCDAPDTSRLAEISLTFDRKDYFSDETNEETAKLYIDEEGMIFATIHDEYWEDGEHIIYDGWNRFVPHHYCNTDLINATMTISDIDSSLRILDYDLETMFDFDRYELYFPVRADRFEIKKSVFNVYFDEKLTDEKYNDVNKNVNEYLNSYIKNIYPGFVVITANGEKLQIDLDLSRITPYTANTATEIILRSLNNVTDIEQVIINE